MFNPYSAVDRIKNQLAYKLGFAILESKKNGRGYVSLLYKLYKIKKEYSLQKNFYKQAVKNFPQLSYPKLEECKDYNESMKYTFHFSYMLGNALIKAHKNWYKGGYCYLYRDIMQVKRDYDIVKNLHMDIAGLKNKEKFFKNYEIIKGILNAHKDYKPILDNIFHNFDFFIENFIAIKEWLYSDEFYQKYKKENHPYPSLLDPKKLNNDNEKLNYNNISPELAWRLNLPLPNKYKMVWLLHPATGSLAIEFFLKLIEIKYFLNPWISAKDIYSNNYLFLKKYFGFIVLFSNYDFENRKILYLIQECKAVFMCVRDPLGLIRHFLNHINRHKTYQNIMSSMKKINLSYSYNFPKNVIICSSKEIPEVSGIEKILQNNTDLGRHFQTFYFTTQGRLDILRQYNKIKNIECLELEDINKENAFDTFTRLAKKYDFTPPNDPIPFQGRVNNSNGDLIYLPVTLYTHPYDLTNYSTDDNTSFGLKGGVNIIITTHQIHPKKDGFVDVSYEIFNDRKLMFDNIILLVKYNEYEVLKSNQELFLASKKYLNNYMDALEKHEQKIKDNLITEEQILDYLKDKKDLRIKLKKILDKDLTYVRENHPEYLQKWKYYQEFEKLCQND
ncbi:TPA: DUF2972 domain-containing protein [Campylobacter coli]|nr:DUF2972 domain-containing protein [Campylobacter coli]